MVLSDHYLQTKHAKAPVHAWIDDEEQNYWWLLLKEIEFLFDVNERRALWR